MDSSLTPSSMLLWLGGSYATRFDVQRRTSVKAMADSLFLVLLGSSSLVSWRFFTASKRVGDPENQPRVVLPGVSEMCP